VNDKGNNGQSGNGNSSGWAKSKDKLGVITAEQRRSHWWFQA
jgi:hypothetical protein